MESGGAYLGLCAGAYYASKKVLFEEGRPLEVVGERELGFFPGDTVGPLFDKTFSYDSEESAESAALRTQDQTFACYYNGGCLFEGASNHDNTEVLARYEDLPNKPAAIVRCSVGKGHALLSGVHLEHAYVGLRRRPLPEGLLPTFKQSEEARKHLFNSLVQELVLTKSR